MAINFSALPTSNPFSLPEPGVYKAKIEEAEMRTPKTDATKPQYLNVKLALFKNDGSKAGTVYDIFSESEASAAQFKLGRFITACGLPLTGSMELKDLGKVVVGRTVTVDITHDKKSDQPRAIVDVFSRECYYPEADFERIYKMVHPSTEVTAEMTSDFIVEDDAEVPFNAADGQATTASANY